jgi:pimeloyl-ACP methyl ester carboxylesterase
MHYVDEGPRDAAEVFLCFHGQPTWSYLYRKMIPLFLEAGHRVVSVDFFGFGRSDKPRDEEVHTFDFHRGSLRALVEHLDLTGITLVCQDWGGTLGLTLPMDQPGRFRRFLIMNTVFPDGVIPLPEGFLPWRVWLRGQPDLKIGRLIGRACRRLTLEERAAYDAPFPDGSFKAGVRRFPCLMPSRADSPGAKTLQRARAWLREEWEGQRLLVVGMEDPVLGPAPMEELRGVIRRCPEPLYLFGVGHFVPEWGDEVASRALAAFAA